MITEDFITLKIKSKMMEIKLPYRTKEALNGINIWKFMANTDS